MNVIAISIKLQGIIEFLLVVAGNMLGSLLLLQQVSHPQLIENLEAARQNKWN